MNIRGIVLAVAVTATAACTPTTATAATTLPRVAIGSQLIANGSVFVPRGVNYVRMATDATGAEYHSTFEPGQYNAERALGAVTKLRQDGYNTVRVFIDNGSFSVARGIGGGLGNSSTPFDSAYLSNVVDFIQKANDNQVYVIPVLSQIPINCYFYSRLKVNSANCGDNDLVNMSGFNAFYMNAGFVAAKALYMQLFAQEMVTRLGNTSGILAYASDNEANFEGNQPPFNTMTGSVTTLTGTYSMTTANSRQLAADQSFTEYAKRVRTGLLAGDPNAELMIGVFTNYAVGKSGFDGFSYCSGSVPCRSHGDWRYPARVSKAQSNIDIIDLHQYSRNFSTGYTVSADLATIERSQLTKPWIIGEFGAFKDFWPNVTDAAYGMRKSQVDACAVGSKGSLFWTMDTAAEESVEMTRMYTLLQDGGSINGQLAPVVRPDQCSTGAAKVTKRSRR